MVLLNFIFFNFCTTGSVKRMADSVDGYCAHRTSDEVRDNCVSCYGKDRIYSQSAFICKTCKNHFCKRCYHAHLPHSAYEKQKENFRQPIKYVGCDKHSQILDKFCCEHYDVVCERCWRDDHADCYVKPLKYIDSFDCNVLRNKQNEFLVNVQAAKEQKNKDIEEQRVSAIKMISSEFKIIIAKLRKQMKNSKEEINKLFKAEQESLNEILDGQSKELQALNETLKNIEWKNRRCLIQEESRKLAETLLRIKLKSREIYKPTKALDIPEAWSKLDKCVDELFATDTVRGESHSKHHKVAYFEEPDIATLKGSQVSKTVQTNGDEDKHFKSVSFKFPLRQFSVFETHASRLEPIHAKTDTDIDDCCITGICVTHNGHLLMSDCYNKSVKLFSKQGKYVTSCVVPGEPWDITTADQNEAAVTLWDNQKTVQFLSFTENSLHLQRAIKLKNRVNGITAVEDRIAITSDDTIPSVILMTKDGQIVWSKQFDITGKRLFVLPGYIVCGKIKDTACLFVSDKEKHAVTTFDAKSGEVLITLSR